MATAAQARLALQGILGVPNPKGLAFGPVTRALFDKLSAADPDSPWPPKVTGDFPAVTNIGAQIIAHARYFVGLTETVPNARWDDLTTPGKDARAEEFRQALLAVGWQSSWAYCAATVEAVLRRTYTDLGRQDIVAKLAPLLTPSACESFENLRRAGLTSKVPRVGAAVFWQHGDTWKGHAGFVEIPGDPLHTIEANTGADGGREGDGIYPKARPFTFARTARGLNLLGFLPPLG